LFLKRKKDFTDTLKLRSKQYLDHFEIPRYIKTWINQIFMTINSSSFSWQGRVVLIISTPSCFWD